MKLSRIIAAEGNACVIVACLGAASTIPILWFPVFLAGVAKLSVADALDARGW